MDYDMLKLENQLCFPLYACSREITKKYKPYLDEIGLTYTQYITMMVLWDKKSVSVKELGEKLYLDSGTLTPMLKAMQQKDLVKRSRSQRDERSTLITITEAGEQLKDKAKEIPSKIGACIPLSENDAATLYSLLYKIIG